jgi:hypothetical protein
VAEGVTSFGGPKSGPLLFRPTPHRKNVYKKVMNEKILVCCYKQDVDGHDAALFSPPRGEGAHHLRHNGRLTIVYALRRWKRNRIW